jgi:hypothetical protein
MPTLHVVYEGQQFRLETVTPDPWPVLLQRYFAGSVSAPENGVLGSSDWATSARRDVRVYHDDKYRGVLPLNTFLQSHGLTLSQLRAVS